MAEEGYGSVISAVLQTIGNIVDWSIQGDQSQRNLNMARNTNYFNKLAWLVSMMREDTAVQRRVKDLRAAGLSPTLAAGSAAQTGAPIRIEKPVLDIDPQAGNRMQNIIQTVNQSRLANVSIDKIESESAKIKQQTYFDLLSQPEKLKNLQKKGVLTDAQASQAFANFKMEMEKYNYLKKTGFMPNEGGYYGKWGQDILRNKENSELRFPKPGNIPPGFDKGDYENASETVKKRFWNYIKNGYWGGD